ncbi:protoheme IX farnesyltransferase [Anaerolineae bacterium CFX9]|jgi:protoheme IX farnesyltransferase|nr:protoheme IX farnesyltransferase [Anaerolineae bacterium CFX9]
MATTIDTRGELTHLEAVAEKPQPQTFRDLVRAHLELTKLRIVLLLLFTTLTAMIIAANGIPPIGILVPTLIGGAMSAAGASVINQYIDRDMDARMSRTARRPIPSGRFDPTMALLFGLTLVVWSTLILGVFVNWLAAALALGGALYYVVLYTLVLKRNTVLNILIGGGAGAMPVLVGWAAVTGSLEFAPLVLFAIVFYWTPPHSWALALLVNTDYARANVPMMPVARGEEVTRRQILYYSIQLLVISLVPVLFGTLGAIYGLAAAALGINLIRLSVVLIQKKDGATARRTYKFSTAYLAFLFMAMIIDRLLL